jgi:ABC-2 type transport system permease protein
VKTFACQVRAFARRDFVTDVTYRLSFAIGAADALFGVSAYFFLSKLIAARPAGYDAFAFILTGIVMNGAMSAALSCYAQAIRDSQHTATLPLLIASPLSPRRLIALSSVYPMVRAASEGLLFLAAGAALGLALSGANALGAIVVFLISMAAFGAVGVLSAACIVVWKRGDPIPWLIGAASWLLGGVFYPVEQLPAWLQGLSRLLPITYALEALRPALLGGVGLGDVLRRAAPLVLFAIVLIPLSLYAFSRAVDRARREGTLRQC